MVISLQAKIISYNVLSKYSFRMQDINKLKYFDSEIYKIFSSDSNKHMDFILEVEDQSKLLKAMSLWPTEIKLAIVDRYLKEEKNELLDIDK